LVNAPTIKDAAFQKSLQSIQKLILDDNILAGHDIKWWFNYDTLEMCFADTKEQK
jgi:hypothetical protein